MSRSYGHGSLLGCVADSFACCGEVKELRYEDDHTSDDDTADMCGNRQRHAFADQEGRATCHLEADLGGDSEQSTTGSHAVRRLVAATPDDQAHGHPQGDVDAGETAVHVNGRLESQDGDRNQRRTESEEECESSRRQTAQEPGQCGKGEAVPEQVIAAPVHEVAGPQLPGLETGRRPEQAKLRRRQPAGENGGGSTAKIVAVRRIDVLLGNDTPRSRDGQIVRCRFEARVPSRRLSSGGR